VQHCLTWAIRTRQLVAIDSIVKPSVAGVTQTHGGVRHGAALLMKPTHSKHLNRKLLLATLGLAVVAPTSAAGKEPQKPVKIGVGAARPLANALAPSIAEFRHEIKVVNRRLRAERRRRERRLQQDAFAATGVSMATLESIAACESGGDPAIVSSDGTYRGKYQFDYGTWESVGGSGDPAAAPESEQDYRAALLYSRSGSSPWPICG
jgi:hypothetical protein